MRLTILQYAGDYREAYNRLSRGGKETYYAQRYSVELVGRLARHVECVTVICALSDEKYDVILDNGVRAVGAGLKSGFHPSQLIPDLVKTRPTRLSLTTPMVAILRWAEANKIRTIAPLADSFRTGGIKNFIRHRRLAYYLNKPSIEWVGNHGINACLSLASIGVRPSKIVPWDWPPSHRPSEYPPRSLRPGGPYELLYAGSVTEAKGVSDLLHAVARLKNEGFKIKLSIVGRDPDGSMIALSKSLNVRNIAHFLGVVPNEDVPEKMRSADAVVVPSRHEYPEGLPLTIYEALSSRTPIIASDHPMFKGPLVHEESALIFEAGNVENLASCVKRLLSDATLYECFSQRSELTWNNLQLPVTMGKLLECWLDEDPDQTRFIQDHSLASGYYDKFIQGRRRNAS